MTELEWRPVVGLEGQYEVSDGGQVRSLDRLVRFRDGRSRWFPGKTLAPFVNKTKGHPRLLVKLPMPDSGWIGRYVHGLVAEAFLGPRPIDMEVLHGPGGPLDNRVSNLRYGSHSENMLDTNRDGTNWHRKRERCPRKHLLQAPNLVAVMARRGRRECLACSRAKANVRNARQRRGIELDLAVEADRHYAGIMAVATTNRLGVPA